MEWHVKDPCPAVSPDRDLCQEERGHGRIVLPLGQGEGDHLASAWVDGEIAGPLLWDDVPPADMAGATCTPSGEPYECDGCHRRVGPLDLATMVFPVLHPEVYENSRYGRPAVWGEVWHVVCPPAADGSQPCLQLARLADEVTVPPGEWCSCKSCKDRRRARP